MSTNSSEKTSSGEPTAAPGGGGFWSRPVDVRDLWRMPGAAGVAIAFASVPLILLFPDAALLVALLALCLYPVLDVPRTLGRPSWWRAAAVSAFVWLVVFALLMATVESVQHLREDSMIFLVPFTMYPLVLVISGLVRLEGRVSGRPRGSGVRNAAILGLLACGLLLGVPITMGIIPVVIAKLTGNSPRNTVYSEEGEVLSAAPGLVNVRMNASQGPSASGPTRSSTSGGRARPWSREPPDPIG